MMSADWKALPMVELMAAQRVSSKADRWVWSMVEMMETTLAPSLVVMMVAVLDSWKVYWKVG